jgi:cytochrome c oxidase assembly protein subunit 11
VGRAAVGRRNRRIAAGLCLTVAGMVGLTFASVPLYRLFCQVTGFGGTTQVADDVPTEILDRSVRVRFVTAVDRGLPWAFEAERQEVTVHLGEPALVFFRVRNTADVPVAGQAVYNVTPDKIGRYFAKVQCFCFDEQVLAPGETAEYPVYFYVDSAMDGDRNLDDVRAVTLSYTFYHHESPAAEAAIAAYGRALQDQTGGGS